MWKIGGNMPILKCKICHKNDKINTNDDDLYKSEIVINNYICCHCALKTKQIKIKLICENCKIEFITKILFSNKDMYLNWKCPKCSSNIIKNVERSKTNTEMNCGTCHIKLGVCNHPELDCCKSNELTPFTNNRLYALKDSDDCSILSICKMNYSRNDIHALKFIPLFKNDYLIAKNNLILIRQRLKSKKNYVTNVIIYKFDKNWNEVFNKNFNKGINWVEEILNFGKLEKF